MRRVGARELNVEGPAGVSRDALTVKRHRNPVGIFSRALIYPVIGLGAWRHRLDLVAGGLALEALLWTAVPPVEETFGFVEDAIETELDWLNAPPGPRKSLSFAVLALFPVVLFAGLWRRSWRLLAASACLIVVFYVLMRRVAGGPAPSAARPIHRSAWKENSRNFGFRGSRKFGGVGCSYARMGSKGGPPSRPRQRATGCGCFGPSTRPRPTA
jgi:hypothetical protein